MGALHQPPTRPSFGGFGDVNGIRQRIESGSMPPGDYLFVDPAARLTETGKQQITQGLQEHSR